MITGAVAPHSVPASAVGAVAWRPARVKASPLQAWRAAAHPAQFLLALHDKLLHTQDCTPPGIGGSGGSGALKGLLLRNTQGGSGGAFGGRKATAARSTLNHALPLDCLHARPGNSLFGCRGGRPMQWQRAGPAAESGRGWLHGCTTFTIADPPHAGLLCHPPLAAAVAACALAPR